MRSTTNPIFVNFGFLGNHREIIPGSSHELYVLVSNRGEKDAVIDVSIEASDDEPTSVLSQWIHPKRARVEIDSNQEKTVSFQIQIPESAWPYDYYYDVILDAPDHYPEHTPLSFPQILKVLPAPTKEKNSGQDPRFLIEPATSSIKPQTIKPGNTFEVEVLVENRTALVDRYYLICSDLKPNFFSVYYPEVRDQYGLIVESDGLELNPGKSGTVKLKFHPPYSAAAGNYFPTIRLASVNNPRLSLLDIVYLHVPPSYELGVEIDTLKDRLKNPKIESGEYQLKIANSGNLERNLIIKTHNRGWGGLSFIVDPDFQTLAPGETSQVQMLVRPIGRWWNRPFYGIGRDFKFAVGLEDLNALPLPSALPEAKLTWEPYPKKWFILLIVLLSVLAAGGAIAIAFAIWNTFFRQPPAPKILELAPVKSAFQEAENEAVQLNWTIENPKQISSLVLTQQGNNGNEVKTFNFKEGIPVELSLRNPTQTDNYCKFEDVKKSKLLVCRGIIAPAKQPGQYQFQLQAFATSSLTTPSSTLKTDTIAVTPAGLPMISELTSVLPEYQLSGPNPSAKVSLSWEITNPGQIKEIKLDGLLKDGTVATSRQVFDLQDSNLPKSLSPFCKIVTSLSCRNVPLPVRKPGLYTFRISITPKRGVIEPSLTKATDVIKVRPPASTKNPSKSKVATVPNAVIASQLGNRTQNSLPKAKTGLMNEFIPPSTWPPAPSPSRNISRFRPPTTQRTQPSATATTWADRQRSKQQADRIVRGLVVADDTGVILKNSNLWQRAQVAISLLRKGNSLSVASQRSGASMDILESLISWGQNRNLPQRAANPKPAPTTTQRTPVKQSSVPSTASKKRNETTFPENLEKPPEPLWGQSQAQPIWTSPAQPSPAPADKQPVPLW